LAVAIVRRMRLSRAVYAWGLVPVLCLLAGCGGSGTSTVTPAAYVKSVCSAVGPFERDIVARSSALNLTGNINPAQGKTIFENFLTAVAKDTDAALNKLKAAGQPNVNNGKAIETAIVGAFSKMKTALDGAAGQAKALPTANPAAFKTAAVNIGRSVQSSLSNIGNSLGSTALQNQQLQKAATKEPACKALTSGA
jgi:hypothetical protein